MDGRYVVGIDGSAPSESALAWAIRRAVRDSAELVLAHVVDPSSSAAGDGIVQALAAVRAAHPELTISTLALEGSVPIALGHAVTAADILVVGTHKTGFLHGRVLGSRTVQIASVASCSVAVVPVVDLRFRQGVVVGIDRLDTAAEVGRVAAIEAAEHGYELTCIQSVPSGTSTDRTNSALAVAVDAARAACPELVIRSRITTRPAAEALLDAARDKALLVLGPGSASDQRPPIGSVLHTVLLNENAPVLVLRPTIDRELANPAAAAVLCA
jgi:nucleotide-binding universal stress UspA family protein